MAGIWIVHRDADARPCSASIIARPCANEPAESHARRAGARARGEWAPWEHGLASDAFDDGATLLCRSCARERRAEAAREARMRRLLPAHRAWLEARGIHDWPIKPSKQAAPSAAGEDGS